jgi:hypothetical protein
MTMACQFLGNRVHVGAGIGLGVDVRSQLVDVNRSLAHRFALPPELFLLLPDLFALLWRPLGFGRAHLELTGSRRRGIGLLRCSEQQNRDEWDLDHRVLRKAGGDVCAMAGAKKGCPALARIKDSLLDGASQPIRPDERASRPS